MLLLFTFYQAGLSNEGGVIIHRLHWLNQLPFALVQTHKLYLAGRYALDTRRALPARCVCLAVSMAPEVLA
jgi:hypothetical protein